MVNMNMIVNASDLVGYEAENKTSKGTQKEMLAKLVAVWEKRNSKQAKKIGTFGLLAVSLAACNDDSDDAAASADLAAQLAAAQAAQAAAETAQAAAEAAQAAVEASSAEAAATPAVAPITTLTASIDNVLPAATSDAITAGIVGTTQTWQSLDNIDMGAGDDTITAIITADVTPNLSNVENIIVSTNTAAMNIDLSGSTGVTHVSSTSSTEVVTFDSLVLGTEMTITNNASDGATFNFIAAGLVGTADVATLNLTNVTGGAGSVVTITDGFETLNVNSSGSVTNSFALTTLTPATINVSGAAGTSFAGTLPTTVTAVDASSSTGAMTATLNNVVSVANAYTGSTGVDTLTMTGGASAVSTVNTGAGNDSVTFTADLLNTTVAVTDSVSGGDGTDTLTGTSAELRALVNTATIPSGISEFETLAVSAGFANVTLTTSNVQTGGFDTLDFAAGSTAAGAGTVNLGSGTRALTFGNVLQSDLVIQDDAVASTNVTTDDVLNISSSGTAAENRGDVLGGAALTVNGFETVNINLTSLGAGNVVQDLGVITLAVDTGGVGVVNFTGAEGLNFDGTTAGVSTLDFSGMTAQAVGTSTVDMDAGGVITPEAPGAAGTMTVTGSPGDDNLNGDTNEANIIDAGAGNDDIDSGTGSDTLSGGSGNDDITGGNGNDTLNGGAGNDTLTGGTGNDAINGGDGNDTMNAGAGTADVVDGGAGNDILVISHATANLSAFDSYTGGDGTDTLRFLNNTQITEDAAAFSSISGFETFEPVHAIAGGAVAYAMSNFINNNAFETLVFEDMGNQTITVSNAPASLNSITVNDGTAGDTLIFSRLVDTTTNAITVTSATTANVTTANIDMANEETITFSAPLAANDINFANATLDDATTIIVTGAGDFGVAAGLTTSTLITSFDSSASTGAVEFHVDEATGIINAVGGSGGLEFTGGLRADTITGSSGADIFLGAAGADILTGNGGGDTLTGGAGNDTLNGGTGADTITGGLGTDTMTGGGADGAVDNFVFTVAQVEETILLADVITDFVTASDTITTAEGANAAVYDGVGYADLAAMVTHADGRMTATAGQEINVYYNALGTGNAYVLVNSDGNDSWAAGGTDGLIVLSGINLATEIVAADFI
jgi:Ca2+-binding RTX toxin-like protein